MEKFHSSHTLHLFLLLCTPMILSWRRTDLTHAVNVGVTAFYRVSNFNELGCCLLKYRRSTPTSCVAVNRLVISQKFESFVPKRWQLLDNNVD